MLGNSLAVAQLAASQEEFGSIETMFMKSEPSEV
jgi:hypothetical protein